MPVDPKSSIARRATALERKLLDIVGTIDKVKAGTITPPREDIIANKDILLADLKTLDELLTEAADLEEADDFYDRLSQTQFQVHRAVNIAKSLIETQNDVQPTATPPQPAQNKRNLLSYPQIKLPTFDGTLTNWLPFYSAFEAVDKDPDLSPQHKYTYLCGQLQGEAAKLVAGFECTDENYVTALDTLKKVYGDQEKLRSAYFNRQIDLDPPSANFSSLNRFQRDMDYNFRQMECLDKDCLNNQLFTRLWVSFLTRKIPRNTYDNMTLRQGGEITSLAILRAELDKEVKRLEIKSLMEEKTAPRPKQTMPERVQPKSKNSYTKPGGQPSRNTTLTTLSATSSYTPTCRLCDGAHSVFKCERYSNRSDIEARIKELQLCFRCLRKGHSSKTCKSEQTCKKCGGSNHHGVLCHGSNQATTERAKPTSDKGVVVANYCTSRNVPTDNESTSRRAMQSVGSEPTTHAPVGCEVSVGCASSGSVGEMNRSVALPTARLTLETRQGTMVTRGFFDLGAQGTFILRSVVEQAGIQSIGTVRKALDSFDTVGESRAYPVVELKVLTETETIKFKAIVVENLPARIQTPGMSRVAADWRLLGEAVADEYVEGEDIKIDILIGADNFKLFMDWPTVAGVPVMRTKVGSMPVGLIPDVSGGSNAVAETITVLKVASPPEDLDRLWNLDNIGISINDAHPDDELAQRTFEESIRMVSDSDRPKYVARLPWKPNHLHLPDNYGQARGRLANSLKQLRANPGRLEAYQKVMQDQLENGFIEKVSINSKAGETGIHYLSHHGVLKDSPTTPLRVVFDCSAKTGKGGVSLNDCLYSGPNLVPELTKVLMRFRMNKFAVTADIKKAFLMIELDERDRDVTRFFWPEDPSDPNSKINVYRFKVVLFGATCSQFILNATIRYHLKNCSADDKDVADQLARNIYVDNVFAAADTEDSITNFYVKASEILDKAGLPLREWATNAKSPRSIMLQDDKHDERVEVPVLGMRWNTDSDQISLAPHHTRAENLTKRGLLSCLAAQYDPLGVAIPVTIRGKMLVQDIWKQRLGWDDEIPDHIAIKWNKVAEDFEALSTLTVNRHTMNAGQVTLHAFADASERAYGAAVYVVQDLTSSLVIAKGRVAPIKELTIPKLELTALVVAARLVNYTQDAFSQEVDINEVHIWTDSKVCLGQLNADKSLQAYVQNRVNEIHRRLPDAKWHHIASKLNPADLISRGCTVSKLKDNPLWWHGPDILLESPLPPEEPMTWEERPAALVSVINEPNQEFWLKSLTERKSSYKRIVQIVARMLRIEKCFRLQSRKKAREDFKIPLSAEEFISAEKFLLREIQHEAFPSIFEALRTNRRHDPRVSQLRVTLRDGLLVCNSRLDEAEIPDSAKFPILMPTQHVLTIRLIEEKHRELLHAGISALCAHLRQRYWIPKARRRVRSVVRNCVPCQKLNGLPYAAPEAPPLPKSRVQEAKPFAATGVDFGGPFTVRKHGGGTEKRYMVLFTCAATRAVHLEVASELSAEEFLHVFIRFVTRRGYPSVMVSDNATNFASASQVLEEWQENHDLRDLLHTHQCRWKFIPSRAPWFGGFYERLVGMTKTILKKAIGRALVTERELQTVLCRIEMLLNDRPLTYVSSELNDPVPLTPSMLVQGRRLDNLPIPVEDPETDHDPSMYEAEVRQRLAHHQRILQRCWERWRKEYLVMLRQGRQKRGALAQPQVDEVVLIHDEGPRLTWQLGRIIELIPGRDEHVRVARVKTSKGTLLRPITKLYPLELKAEPPDPTTDIPDSTAEPPDPTTDTPDLAAEPPESAAEPPDSTAEPPDSIAEPPDPTAEPSDLTAEPPDPTMEPPAEDPCEEPPGDTSPRDGSSSRGPSSSASDWGTLIVPQRGAARKAGDQISRLAEDSLGGSV